jgi:hypothetical protein
MKTLSIILSVAFLTIAHLNVNATDLSGDSNTGMGKFQITEQSSVTENGEVLRAFQVKYENSEQPVIILLDEKKNCRDYIVRSKNLEIRYTCKKNSFGAKYVTAKFAQFDPTINDYFLDKEEFENQEIISAKELGEKEALGIIASYFPQLIKDQRLLM